ncbi:phytoene desaturase [soil metagenome]|nr:phytoene desaturase [Gemmatimonadota bacterium]
MSTDPVVVIGAGLGGLAAAIRLRARGYSVMVLEATDQPGGRASVFRRDGFTFDAGPTVITAPYLIDELFQLVGRDPRDYFTFAPVDPFYRVEYPDGSRFDYVGDEERILAQIAEMSPRDVDGYRRLAAHAERIFDIGYTRLADQPFNTLGEMLRVVPDMVRLGSYRTVYGLVARYISDERLRQAFSFQPLLVGGNPFRVTSIYMLIHWLERKWGVHFALGGTTSIVNAMVRLLNELGVEVRCGAAVERIEVERGRARAVRIEGGERIPCRMVVANGDPVHIYSRLVAPAHRKTHTDRALRRRKLSMGLFVGYFGTRKTYPDLAHHTILMGPRYRELLEDIFERKVLAEDFSLYLHAPTRTDPSLAPPGHEAFYVLSPVPNNRSGIDWETEGPRYFDRILDHLDATYLPGLRENLVTRFHVTPNYFEQELRSVDGAGFGIEPRLSQSAYFRFHNRSEDVEGLYFVGAGTHPGAGIPGVLCSAKVLDRVIPPAGPVPMAADATRVVVPGPRATSA